MPQPKKRERVSERNISLALLGRRDLTKNLPVRCLTGSVKQNHGAGPICRKYCAVVSRTFVKHCGQ